MGFESEEHCKTEFLPFAAHVIGCTRLSNAQALGALGLRELLLLDVRAQITHQRGAHFQNGRLDRFNAEIN